MRAILTYCVIGMIFIVSGCGTAGRTGGAETTGHTVCATCHQPAGVLILDPNAARVCDGCHPKTSTAMMKHYSSATLFEGAMERAGQYMSYVVETGSVWLKDNKCLVCHNPHDAAGTFQFNQEWAESGHGDITGAAWVADEKNAATSCGAQRCHTGTGYSRFLARTNKGSTYTFANWSAIALTKTDNTKEVLYCLACHVDYTWTRKAAKTYSTAVINGPYLKFKTYTSTYSRVTGYYPLASQGDSDLCINCHVGTGSSGYSKAQTAATLSLISSSQTGVHHGYAAGTLYGIIGFEHYSSTEHYKYTGNAFLHDKLGRVSTWGFFDLSSLGTTRGPCVACHMDSKNHKFEVVETAAAADPIDSAVTSIPANAGVCTLCHAGVNVLSPAGMTISKTTYRNRINALKAGLQAYGIYFYYPALEIVSGTATVRSNFAYNPVDPLNPTFSECYVKWGQAVALTGSSYGDRAKHLLGAALNLVICHDEPAGYVHNSKYTADLLYDSFDFLDDGILNGSPTTAGTSVTMNGIAVANPWSGVARP